jgi:hypothetical protein
MLSSPAAGQQGRALWSGRQPPIAKPSTIWFSRAREPINSATSEGRYQ